MCNKFKKFTNTSTLNSMITYNKVDAIKHTELFSEKNFKVYTKSIKKIRIHNTHKIIVNKYKNYVL